MRTRTSNLTLANLLFGEYGFFNNKQRSKLSIKWRAILLNMLLAMYSVLLLYITLTDLVNIVLLFLRTFTSLCLSKLKLDSILWTVASVHPYLLRMFNNFSHFTYFLQFGVCFFSGISDAWKILFSNGSFLFPHIWTISCRVW